MRSVSGSVCVLILVLLAGGCGAATGNEQARETEPRFSERFVRSPSEFPPQDEKSWPAALQTACASAPDNRPAICLRRTTADLVGRGDPLAAEISWSGAPADASVIVYLEHDGAPTERYLGARGPLMLRPLPAAGTGSTTFQWNGRDFPCAPTDAPMLCRDPVEIGRYRLRVALYDRRRITIAGRPFGEPPIVLAYALSSPFVVTGQPDLGPLARTMWWAAATERMRLNEIDSSSALAGDGKGSAVRIRERDGQLCGRIPGNPPYVSTLEACVPKARMIGEAGLLDVPSDAISVTGRVTVASGTISRREAITLAQAVADTPYRQRVRFHRQPQPEEAGYDFRRDGDFMEWSRRNPWATTYLSDSVGEEIYRPDLGGAWLIVVNELMAGGSLPDEQRFADKVLVLVQGDRRACVLETRPYKGEDFSHDPRTARRRC